MVPKAREGFSLGGALGGATTAVLRLPTEKLAALKSLYGRIPDSAWQPGESALPASLPKGARLIPVKVMDEPMVQADPHADAHLLVLSHQKPADATTVYFTRYSGGIIGIEGSAGPQERGQLIFTSSGCDPTARSRASRRSGSRRTG
jgi:hypothetical protein